MTDFDDPSWEASPSLGNGWGVEQGVEQGIRGVHGMDGSKRELGLTFKIRLFFI